jgi:hypothetical protein
MQKLTFEQLPEAVALLLEKIERIEKLLSSNDEQDQFELRCRKSRRILKTIQTYHLLKGLQR